MRTNQTEKKAPVVEDWHQAEIIASLKKSGTNMSALSEAHGYSRGALRNALYRPYPKAERIIAEAIGVEPKDIWPTRYTG
ncbi:helix-turn-helix domain-containing protein [Psychrobacter sp. FDAARGOS_221]|uniref:helix-turn-helix domain-containing protein n=1 Tax=Psychrobacter sp. FDAARGOS_221 TaxID=1975705 RepID=UPI000BB5800C|nr:helix-turn-helix transcriptional regulator [Psychrobacter sp. FDAARGOS_221]PNK61492.1 transcriptional regulator [Psychrobacter sp. FDAARGOS_221]